MWEIYVMRFEFTKSEIDYFLKNCYFSEEEEKIFILKLKNYSITEMALKLNISERTVSRRLNSVKKKILRSI